MLSPCIDSTSELHDMFDFMFEQMDLYVFGLSFANAAALLCKHYCNKLTSACHNYVNSAWAISACNANDFQHCNHALAYTFIQSIKSKQTRNNKKLEFKKEVGIDHCYKK